MERSELASASTADLVKLATEQVKVLVHDEVELAKAEMAEKGKQVGVGAGLFGAAGVFAFYGAGLLFTAITLALALVMPAWAAALIVSVLLFLVAAVCVLVGRRHLRRGTPAAPADTIASVKADLASVSTAFKEKSAYRDRTFAPVGAPDPATFRPNGQPDERRAA
jgi:hypothetical protein